MSVALQLDLNQLKSLISQCDPQEKLELVRQLENETFTTRLARFRSKMSKANISLDEITEEVEEVRRQRYAR